MNVTKRITSLVLTLVMLFSLACTGVWTPHVHAEEPTALDDLKIVHVNPLYADIITEADLVKPNPNLLYGDNTDGEHYYDTETAGEMIRDDLVARDTTIVVDIYGAYTSQETLQDDAVDMIYDVLSTAMVHTGNPTEGDYILWQYAGFEASLTDAYYDSTTLYMTLTFTMTYHANAAQEAEVNTAVTKLLGELNVAGKDDYTKLKAIYDYITSNVTYDEVNKNNADYKLKHSAYAALINKTAVCQGYAVLLYRLALELGVDCRLIPGNGNGEAHGWNIAKVGNQYYNLDSTWDAGLTPAQYQCFLVGSKNFANHVRWDKPGELPTEENYNSAEFNAKYPMSEYDYAVGCEHDYSAAITTPATCTEKGIKTFTCTKCGDSYTEAIPSIGHNYDKTSVVAPTCDEKGYTAHICSNCGDSYQDTLVPATGHSYDDGVITKASTCAEAGVKTFTCSVCKSTYTESLPTLDHVYDKVEVTAPTCTEQGYTTHTCSACGDFYKDTLVSATGHSYDDGVITTQPTCTEDGVVTYTCTSCTYAYTEVIETLGHAYDDGKVTMEATCTGYGTLVHTCSRCGSTINAYVDPLGHAYKDGEVTTQPTCTKEGVMTYPCIRGCGNTTTSAIPVLEHTPDEGTVTLAPTCTEEGTLTCKCTMCGVTILKTIPATGHDFSTGTCPGCNAKAVVITAEPKTAYAKMGEIAKATVTAEGEDLTYQWYIRNSGKEKYSKSSVTGPTYSCTMSEKSKDRRALCIIKDKYGNEVQSKTIVIRESVSIVTEPKTAYAQKGEVAKVKMEVTGDGLTYQWYIRNANESEYRKSTVTSATYSCKMSDTAKDRRVLCIITDKYGNKVQTKTVIIRMAATITEQPVSVTVKKGEMAEATVTAVGDGLFYQWYIKNKNSDKFVESSLSSATYYATMSKKVNGRQAYCVIKDKYGNTVTTDIITLTMK